MKPKPTPTPKPPAKGTVVNVNRARSQAAANRVYNAKSALSKTKKEISKGSMPWAANLPWSSTHEQLYHAQSELNAASKNYQTAHAKYLASLKKANSPNTSKNANARRKNLSGKP